MWQLGEHWNFGLVFVVGALAGYFAFVSNLRASEYARKRLAKFSQNESVIAVAQFSLCLVNAGLWIVFIAGIMAFASGGNLDLRRTLAKALGIAFSLGFFYRVFVQWRNQKPEA